MPSPTGRVWLCDVSKSGGRCEMLAVDFARLHPVMGKPLHATHDLTPEKAILQTVYRSFDETTIGLTRIIRQSSDIRL
jgi:hypothetical protein